MPKSTGRRYSLKRTGTNPESSPQGFMSLDTAAKWADVSRKTVQRWISKGLPVYQEGPRSKVLIRPADIDEFLTRRQLAQPELDQMVAQVMKDFAN